MRKEGNTAQLIQVILRQCKEAGIKTEFVSLAGKKILPCLGCLKCKEKKW
ncbi:NAD(P)H-dependent oxidoreductase, partial [Methanoregula sp.]